MRKILKEDRENKNVCRETRVAIIADYPSENIEARRQKNIEKNVPTHNSSLSENTFQKWRQSNC
jgi:hypothetical protein